MYDWMLNRVNGFLTAEYYTVCHSNTAQVEHAPLEMFTLSSIVTKARK
jgi:hypothetical protein